MPSIRDPRRPSPRARRGLLPSVDSLEGRSLMTAAPVTLEATYGPAGSYGYERGPTTVVLTPYEPGGNPATMQTFYRINDGPLTPGKVVTLSTNGFYFVTFFSIDASGHYGPASGTPVDVDDLPPVITAFASPTTLWPPNNALVPVTVSGFAGDALSGTEPVVFYQVLDSEGQYQPGGFAVIQPNGFYSFTVDLPASRLGQDRAGRTFAIDVFARDYAGNVSAAVTFVVVPHDMGHAPVIGFSPAPGDGGDDNSDDQGDWGGPGNSGGHGHSHGKGRG